MKINRKKFDGSDITPSYFPALMKTAIFGHFSQYRAIGIQGCHDEFEPGKVQYSTPKFFDRLFLIRAY